jgi:hypothetical protein
MVFWCKCIKIKQSETELTSFVEKTSFQIHVVLENAFAAETGATLHQVLS